MKVVKAPSTWIKMDNAPTFFLAGSIEMGTATNWQQRFEAAFANDNIVLLNPRRDDWDSTWEQSIENDKFYEQVTWELNNLENADRIALYFDPATKSPISLLELGLFTRGFPNKLAVCCPEGFWRRGNVEIVCSWYNVTFFDNEEEWIEFHKHWLYAKEAGWIKIK